MSSEVPGVALVAGASKGIGKATAIAYAAAGVRGLVLAARTQSELEAVAEEAKKVATNKEFKTIVVLFDITSEDSIKELISKSVAEFGRIDYAANIAGRIAPAFIPFADTPLQTADDLYQINTRGTWLLTREELKAMKAQEPLQTSLTSDARPAERGSIVNVSSTVALGAMPMGGAYVPTKYAINGLTKTAAIDHAADNIRVNAILPGYTFTEGLQSHPNASPELVGQIVSNIAMKRLAAPEENADVVVFLSSPRASYVTGASWAVDGGVSLP